MNILVTGSAGFVGSHLRAALHPLGGALFGAGQEPCDPEGGETYRVFEIRDAGQVRSVVEEADPDWVFHLAAVTGHGNRVDDARLTVDVNVLGTRHLMDALAARGRPVRVVHQGSSAQYGAVPDRHDPVDENAPQCPLGVYGWSKAASEAVAMSYDGRGGIEVVGARSFNQTGPGEPPHLVVASFARQVAAAEAGAEPVIRVGNLEAVRDFTDVRDTVHGLVKLAQHGAPGGVYNLCSGRGVRVADVLGMLLDKSRVAIDVRADPGRARTAELSRQVGDGGRARREIGWEPEIEFDTSLSDLLEEWRVREGIAKESPL